MPKTLLLADDSVTIQKVVAISFASEDIAITTVDNGDDAVIRAGELRPDVILADVVMPGKSGYEVCEAIKADPALRHIPVLLLTGTFEAFDEERALRAGAAGHVAKPFEAQALVERVRELLRAPAVAAAPAVATTPPAIEAAPASPIADADDAFDFFDDEPQPAQEARSLVSDGLSSPDLELAPGDSAFSFGDEDLNAESDPVLSQVLEPVQPVAHTVAILPDEPSAAGSLAEPSVAAAGGGETVLAMPPEPAAAAADDGFDFESMSPPSPRETYVEAFAESAVLDPAADSGFVDPAGDSRDLEPPPGLEFPPDDSTQILDSDFGGDAGVSSPESLAPEPVDDAFADDEDDSFDPDPIEEQRVEPDSRFVEAPPSFADPQRLDFSEPEFRSEPVVEREPMLRSEPVVEREPMLRPEPVVEREPTLRPEPVVEPEPGRVPLDAQATAEAVLQQVAPELHAQLHETLERIAWEAFGQVTEKIVAQAVERLESISWEVVPKLAETLILEEIRKLKGE